MSRKAVSLDVLVIFHRINAVIKYINHRINAVINVFFQRKITTIPIRLHSIRSSQMIRHITQQDLTQVRMHRAQENL
jgi:hypothetical protein